MVSASCQFRASSSQFSMASSFFLAAGDKTPPPLPFFLPSIGDALPEVSPCSPSAPINGVRFLRSRDFGFLFEGELPVSFDISRLLLLLLLLLFCLFRLRVLFIESCSLPEERLVYFLPSSVNCPAASSIGDTVIFFTSSLFWLWTLPSDP